MKKFFNFLRIVISITTFHLIPMGITILWIVLLCMGHFEYLGTYVIICAFVLVIVGISLLTEKRFR